MSNKRFSLGIDFEEFCLALHGSHPPALTNVIVDDFTNETFSLLQLLTSLKIYATFFISSHTASSFPELVKLISSMGHEIASHGHKHISRQLMDDESFLYDSEYSRGILEELVNKPVAGYRSPLLSISRTEYISSVKILKSAGYRYDSSIISSKCNEIKYKVSEDLLPDFSIVPLTDINLFGLHFNLAGGSIWRLLPPRIVSTLLLSHLASDNSSLYIHPYEFSKFIRLRRISTEQKKQPLRDMITLIRWNINNKNTSNILRLISRHSEIKPCSFFCRLPPC